MSSRGKAHLVLHSASTRFVVAERVRSHNTDLMSLGISYVPVFPMTNFSTKKEWVIKDLTAGSCCKLLEESKMLPCTRCLFPPIHRR